jgi:L-arabinose isomerase
MSSLPRPKVGLLITALLEDDWNKTGYLRPKAQAAVQCYVAALQPFADVVCPGLIETEEQAVQADLTFKSAGVSAVIFSMVAYTQSVVPMRALSAALVPIIVWNTQMLSAWPVEADWDLVMLNSGLAGLPETTHALTRAGIPFQIVTGHMQDARALARLQEYIQAAAITSRLRWMRVGMVGHPYQSMSDLMIDPFSLRATLGPALIHIEPEEIAAAVAQAAPADVARLIQEAREQFRCDELSAEIFEQSARYAAGLESVARARKLDALAHFDQCLLSDPRCGVVPSWGECRLMAAGIPVTAEADVNLAVAMRILQELSGEASFGENYGFDFDQGVAYIAHDSIGNPNLAAADPRPALRPSIYYLGRYGYGAAMEFAYRPGPVTFLALVQTPAGRPGQHAWKMIAGEGEALPVIPRPIVAPQMLFRPAQTSLEEFYDRWCLSGAGHHSALAYGHLGSALQTLAKMLNLQYELVR